MLRYAGNALLLVATALGMFTLPVIIKIMIRLLVIFDILIIMIIVMINHYLIMIGQVVARMI